MSTYNTNRKILLSQDVKEICYTKVDPSNFVNNAIKFYDIITSKYNIVNIEDIDKIVHTAEEAKHCIKIQDDIVKKILDKIPEHQHLTFIEFAIKIFSENPIASKLFFNEEDVQLDIEVQQPINNDGVVSSRNVSNDVPQKTNSKNEINNNTQYNQNDQQNNNNESNNSIIEDDFLTL